MAASLASARMGQWQEQGVRVAGLSLTDHKSRLAVGEALLKVDGYTRYCVAAFMRGDADDIPEAVVDKMTNAVSEILSSDNRFSR